jgi:hypothetical protein
MHARRGASAVFAVLAVAVAGCAPDDSAGQHAADRWRDYSRCLIGEAPLAPGETLRDRLVRIDVSTEAATPAQADWPSRCAPLAEKFANAAQDLPKDQARYNGIAYYGEHTFPLGPTKLDVLADLFVKAESQLPAPNASSTPTGPAAPVPAPTLHLDKLTALATGDVWHATTSSVHEPVLRLLWETHPRRSCRFSAALDAAECADLSPAIGGSLLELAPTPAAAAEGGPLLWVTRTDSTLVLADGATGAVLSVEPAGRRPTRIGDFDLWFGTSGTLLARPTAQPASAPVTVGAVPTARYPNLQGCILDDGSIAALVSADGVAAVAFHGAAGWSSVVQSPWTWVRGTTMTCRPGELVLTAIKAGAISQLRCTASGCARADAPPLDASWTRGDPELTEVSVNDLDGKVLVVGAAKQNGRFGYAEGSIRFRLAPIGDLATTPDVVIVGADDSDYGIDWMHAQTFVRGSAALVLLSGYASRFFAVRIDATGALTPVRVDRR